LDDVVKQGEIKPNLARMCQIINV